MCFYASKQYTREKTTTKKKKIIDETIDEDIGMAASDYFGGYAFLVLIYKLISELAKREEVYNGFNKKFSFLNDE